MLNTDWKVCWFGISPCEEDTLKVDLCVSWRLREGKTYFAEIDISKEDKESIVSKLAEKAREDWQTEMNNLKKVSLAPF